MIKFILCIVNEMFYKESFLAFRPDYKSRFTVSAIQFICVNGKNGKFKENEPVIAEIASFRSVEIDKATLLKIGFTKLPPDEVKEVHLHFLTESKKPEELLESV